MPSAERRLAGRSVVVTRAAEQGHQLTELLTVAGAAVIELPLIEVVDAADGGDALSAALERLATFDWLIVTSPNGAARVAAHVAAHVAAGPTPLAGVRVAAVGTATAAALALGRPADVVPARSIAEGVLEALAEELPGRALVVQGDRARPTLTDGLLARGWEVEQVVAYRTVAARPPADALDAALHADAITFASGSTVESFVAAVGHADRHPPVVVSIGPATTAVAAALGLRVTATADPHTLAGIVAALTSALTAP